METKEKELINGFNDSYLLAKYEPELANLVTKNQNDHSEYFQGLVSGKEEYDKEKNIDINRDISKEHLLDKNKKEREREVTRKTINQC